MGNATPNRGYNYPLYPDAMDFPAAIQELAQDINADVGALQNYIQGAYQRPSARVTQTVAQPIPANTMTPMTFVGAGTNYANGITPRLTAGGGLTLTQQGVYLVTAYINFAAPGAASTFGLQLSIHSNKSYVPNIARVTVRAHTTQATWLNATGMHYNDGVGNDELRLEVWQNSATTRSIASLQMSATKISNVIGGS